MEKHNETRKQLPTPLDSGLTKKTNFYIARNSISTNNYTNYTWRGPTITISKFNRHEWLPEDGFCERPKHVGVPIILVIYLFNN